MQLSSTALHLNLDDAWPDEALGLHVVDARRWGAQLRFSAPPRVVEEFYREHEAHLATPYMLYGSGDFHYLTALRLRALSHPVVLVSFDNHPDWDVRPPRWGCGGWINRALELTHVRRVSVWGCGNFECWWPHQLFGNRRAERAGTLEVHPWVDDRPPKDQQRRGAMLRANWHERFEHFVKTIEAQPVYVTIDLDCLRADEAVTNWESGRYTIGDVEWALHVLRDSSQILGGDICGAYSPPAYARRKQRFAAEFDHPKINLPPADQVRRINLAALEQLWPSLAQSL